MSSVHTEDTRVSSRLVPVRPPVALTIAASDSSGGSGVSADVRTFAAFGVHGVVAVTAVTAQDTEKVHVVVPVGADVLEAQLDAVLGDFRVSVAKTGMLATPQLVECIATRAAARRLPPLVVDLLLVSTTGSPLFEGDAAVDSYRSLIPYAAVLVADLAAAEALTGMRVRYLAELRQAARALHALGPGAVVLKGGSVAGPQAIDVIANGEEVLELGFPKVATRNTHGAGCAYSAAIAANLALGLARVEAVRRARAFAADAIVRSARLALGSGPGPLDLLGTMGEG